MRKQYTAFTSDEEQVVLDFRRRFILHRAIKDAQRDVCTGVIVGASIGLLTNLIDLYVNGVPKSCRKRDFKDCV